MKSILHLQWLAGRGSKIFHEGVASFFFIGFLFLFCLGFGLFGVFLLGFFCGVGGGGGM